MENIGRTIQFMIFGKWCWDQGCRMVCFRTSNPDLSYIFGRALELPFGILYIYVVYFVVVGYTFPRFGMLYQEESGNPGGDMISPILVLWDFASYYRYLWRERARHFVIGSNADFADACRLAGMLVSLPTYLWLRGNLLKGLKYVIYQLYICTYVRTFI
jgi:hypothetical protein